MLAHDGDEVGARLLDVAARVHGGERLDEMRSGERVILPHACRHAIPVIATGIQVHSKSQASHRSISSSVMGANASICSRVIIGWYFSISASVHG